MRTVLDHAQFRLIAVVVLITIATHLTHLPPWLAPSLAVVIALRAWRRRLRPGAVPALLRLPLAIVLLIAIIGDYGNVFGREPGSAFGCGLLALKLLETESARDARVVLGFCAFVLMSALLFVQSLLFTLFVCTMLVVLVAALNRLEPAPLSAARPLRHSLALAARLLLAALPLTLASFVLVPRLGSPLWGSPGGAGSARSGLSDRMAPGQFSELMLDDTPAMRVSFVGKVPLPSAQYFRAIVLTDFDGTTWTRALSGLRRDHSRARFDGGNAVDYEVTLEPTQQRYLPALELPLDAPQDAILAGDDTVIAARPVTQLRQYALTSVIGGSDRQPLSTTLRRRTLALPDGYGPRARALAAQWRAQAGDDAGVVRMAQAMFHEQFTYTLSPPLLGRDSVDEFLFDTKAGFCEHYASAFVFLMRAAGIPARVVAGYQGGWWSSTGGYLLVRQADAHAWAEVWRDGRGWMRVDPTAAVAPQRIEHGAPQVNDAPSWVQAGWLRALRNRVDIINRWWTQAVVGFDALRQRKLLGDLGLAQGGAGKMLLVLSGVLALVLLLATIWTLREAPARHADALDRAWARLRRDLGRAGHALTPADGPRSLWLRVDAHDPVLANSLRPLVDRYTLLRYACMQPTDSEVAGLARDAAQWSRQHLRARIIQLYLRSMLLRFQPSSRRGPS